MANHWDMRYREHDIVYGYLPNVFMASQLAIKSPGSLYLPCDGEGRNGVWAAKEGWRVRSFDASAVGVKKSVEWAAREGVSIQVEVADAMEVDPKEKFDVVALVFAHMPPSMREAFHRRAWSWVKPGGILVVEGFHKDQFGLASGGPKDVDMLFDETTFVKDLKGELCQTLWSAKCEQHLDEGPFHQGKAITCQWVLRKTETS